MAPQQSSYGASQVITTVPAGRKLPGRIDPKVRGWRLNFRNVGLAPYGLGCTRGLSRYTGPARPPAGARIHRKLITVPLDLSNGNIVVSKSCIRPRTTGAHNDFLVTTTRCAPGCRATGGRVVIRDSEINGLGMGADQIARSCGFLGIATLRRNVMHGMGSGICYFETGLRRSALAEQNYVTGLRSWGDSHNEAATVRDFRTDVVRDRRLVLRHNRLDCSSGNVTAALFIQPTWDDIRNVDVIGNYLEGEGYNLYLDGTIPGESGTYGALRSINNRFRSTGWGESLVAAPPGWAVWRDNYVYNPFRKGKRGRAVKP